jgi:DNA-binding LytR/AlgR family response regulator
VKCIAIDDERLVLDLLEDNIRQIPFLELIKSCKHVMEAYQVLQEEKIDLIFLDIQMPRLDGLSFLRSLPHPPMVILVTAYEHYALEAFQLNVIDYLMKPVSFERFLQACNKAYEWYRLHDSATKGDHPDYFFVYVEYDQVKVSIPDILYIEGMKDYVKIYLTSSSKPLITKMSLKSLEQKLAAYRFVRIHKSYIVSADKIKALKRDLISIGDTELPLGEKYKDEVKKILPL